MKLQLNIKDYNVRVHDEYICLTDMTKGFNAGRQLVRNWLRNKSTLDFIHAWELTRNKTFKAIEFEHFKTVNTGDNTFLPSPGPLVEKFSLKSMRTVKGRYGGTYASREVAFHFAMWLSGEFYLLVIDQYFNMLEAEYGAEAIDWKVRRSLTQVNYHLHTDAVKLIEPPKIDKLVKRYIHANEADLLNLAVFGVTAAEWRANNPDKKGNMRDYATMEHLVVLANLQSLNSHLITEGLIADERVVILNEEARRQLTVMQNLNRNIGDRMDDKF